MLADGDDIQDKSRLQKQLQWMKKNPETDILFAQVNLVDCKGGFIEKTRLKKVSMQKIRENIFKTELTVFKMPTCFCKRSVFDHFRFNEDLKRCQDGDMFVRLQGKYVFGIMPDAVLDYRLRPYSEERARRYENALYQMHMYSLQLPKERQEFSFLENIHKGGCQPADRQNLAWPAHKNKQTAVCRKGFFEGVQSPPFFQIRICGKNEEKF